MYFSGFLEKDEPCVVHLSRETISTSDYYLPYMSGDGNWVVCTSFGGGSVNSVRVYERTGGSPSWSIFETITLSDINLTAGISYDGTWLIVGDPFYNVGSYNYGTVRIYERVGSSYVMRWSETGTGVNSYVGRSVGVNGDGTTFVITKGYGTGVGEMTGFKVTRSGATFTRGSNTIIEGRNYHSRGIEITDDGSKCIIGSDQGACVYDISGVYVTLEQILGSGPAYKPSIKPDGSKATSGPGVYEFNGTWNYLYTSDVNSLSAHITNSDIVFAGDRVQERVKVCYNDAGAIEIINGPPGSVEYGYYMDGSDTGSRIVVGDGGSGDFDTHIEELEVRII